MKRQRAPMRSFNANSSFSWVKKSSLKPTNVSAESNFTYDLDAMRIAISSPKVTVPYTAISTENNFDEWLNG